MKRIATLLLLSLLTATAAVARRAPAQLDVDGKSIVILMAHADDEQFIAPLLADACGFGEARCHFVVTAIGMSFGCALAGTIKDPTQCEARRFKEMREAAKRLHGTVEFLRWTDLFYSHDAKGLARTLEEWSQAVGGRERLRAQIAAILQERKADVVFTLDPRHGSSCHPAHRGVALLLAEVVNALPKDSRPQVWLEETTDLDELLSPAQRAERDRGGVFPWPRNRAPVAWYDGSQILPNGRMAHSYTAMVHRIHASQDPNAAAEKEPPPPERMRIPFVNLRDIKPTDDFCTRLKLDRPTFEKPGMMERLTRE